MPIIERECCRAYIDNNLLGLEFPKKGECAVRFKFGIKTLEWLGKNYYIYYSRDFERLLDYVAEKESIRTGECVRDILGRMGWQNIRIKDVNMIYIQKGET